MLLLETYNAVSYCREGGRKPAGCGLTQNFPHALTSECFLIECFGFVVMELELEILALEVLWKPFSAGILAVGSG